MPKGIVRIALAMSLAACGADLEVDSSAHEIIGGTASAVGDYPTTVAINNGGICTGTLIAPDLVLTAAHCIFPALIGASSQDEVTANTIVVLDTDNLFGGGGIQRRATATIPHTSYNTNGIGDNDIGLIRLAQPITDRAPTPINRSREDAAIGITVTQVGYGVTTVGSNAAGRLFALLNKKSLNCSTYGASDANLMCFSQTDGSGKCQGDSGGPSFATFDGVERVVGVTSFGDQDCTRFGADTRVDAELDFLFSVAPELQCQADGACNEVCGSGGLPADSDCSLCTKNEECDDGNVCAADGQCVPAPFTPGGDGAECTDNSDCGSNLCATGPEGSLCTSTCDSENACFDGLECRSAGDGNVCWPISNDSGGCSVAPKGEQGVPAGALLLLLAAAVGLRRRRE